MKAVLILVLALSSLVVSAKCIDIKDSDLSSDQRIVNNLLQAAYKYKAVGISSTELSDFTYIMKRDYVQASEYLDEGEIASIIINQDEENNICPIGQMVGSETLNGLISDVIVETYYGCGCEH